MTPAKLIAAAALLAVPLLATSAPAEAYTARQSALQGRGLYTTSKGVPEGYAMPRRYGRYGWHRRQDWRYRHRYGY